MASLISSESSSVSDEGETQQHFSALEVSDDVAQKLYEDSPVASSSENLRQLRDASLAGGGVTGGTRTAAANSASSTGAPPPYALAGDSFAAVNGSIASATGINVWDRYNSLNGMDTAAHHTPNDYPNGDGMSQIFERKTVAAPPLNPDVSADGVSNFEQFLPGGIEGGSSFAGLPTRVDVLIIGAGPSGLALGCDLARRGVDFRIVDMNPTQVTSSRAMVLHSRTLEILADLGVVDAALANGQIINGLRLIVSGAAVADMKLCGLDSQYPFSLALEQFWTEKLLINKLNELEHDVHRNVAVSRIDVPSEAPSVSGMAESICQPLSSTPQASILLAAQSAVGPRRNSNSRANSSAFGLGTFGIGTPSRLLSELMAHYPCQVSVKELDDSGLPIAGQVKDIRCRYIVGADGSRSVVRRAMDIDFVHRSLPVEILVADVSVAWGCEIVGEKFHLVQNIGGVLLAVPMSGGRWRVVCSRECPPSQTDVEAYYRLTAPADSELQQILDTLVPGTELHRVVWSAAYAINCRVASQFKKYCAFLIGDAAQVHPPTFAQGLNTGIQDAYNLGWKLSAVLNGANSTILDSYDEERRHAAEDAVRFSNRGYEQILRSGGIMRCCIGVLGPMLSQIGQLQTYFSRCLSQVDLTYPPSSIIGSELLKGAGAIVPGVRMPDCRIVGLQLGGTGPERNLTTEMPRSLQEFVREGCHTLLLCVHVLPPGTKVRTLFGCERNQEAARWSLPALEKLARVGRLLSDSLKGVSLTGTRTLSQGDGGAEADGSMEDLDVPDLRVVWVVCGLVDFRSTKNTIALGQIKDHLPHRLKWYFTYGSDISSPVYVAVDHQNELHNKLGLHLTNPDEATGAMKSGAALLVRPDGVLAYSAYGGDVGATSYLLDYGLQWFSRCKC